MIQITISTDPKSFADVAEHGDVRVTSQKSCAARKLARLLVAEGVPDQPIEACGKSGAFRYSVPSLHAFARKILIELPSLGLGYWSDHPRKASTYGSHRASELARGVGVPKRRRAAP